MPRILVVEDEPGIADAIEYALRTDGHGVTRCPTLAQARTRLDGADLLVLDVGLPDGNGFEFCRELRRSRDVPVIFLTARADEIDRVVGLEIGADDYLVKPFSPRELAARVRAVLRRSRTTTTATGTPLVLDAQRRNATWHGRALDLTRYEFRLLEVLAEHPGRVFSRSQLLDLVWEHPDASFDRTVDTHIKTLRAKFHTITPDDDPITTLRGEGYALADGC